MHIKPLSKAIHAKAKSLGVTKITLKFSGGSDEGYLTVDLEGVDAYGTDIEKEIEEWAWSVYEYSGAGDGNDYGDDITYDLENSKVESNEWHMVRQDNGFESDDLELDN